MASGKASVDDTSAHNEVEFFGVKLKVKNPHLATLLNSGVNEDVQVIGRRARAAFSHDGAESEDSLAERQVARRLSQVGPSVEVCPHTGTDSVTAGGENDLGE